MQAIFFNSIKISIFQRFINWSKTVNQNNCTTKSHLTVQIVPNRVQQSGKHKIFSATEKTVNWPKFTTSLRSNVSVQKEKGRNYCSGITRSWLVCLDVDILNLTRYIHVTERSCVLVDWSKIFSVVQSMLIGLVIIKCHGKDIAAFAKLLNGGL